MRKFKVMRLLFIGVLLVLNLASCNKDENIIRVVPGTPNNPPPPRPGDWLIPKNEVFDGGPGKDGIPALENPEKISVNNATFLTNEELVIGFFDGENAVAYPHQILDWHEIINDELNNFLFAITYCPLTGTAIGWKRFINGKSTTFGVSGLLYDNNLIPYDRSTDSNWSQMRLECVNGDLITTKIKTFSLVETKWKTWKEMYPSTKVVSLNTGYDRSYGVYPYLDYRTNENFLLGPLSTIDKRLNGKERVLGIIIDKAAKVYRFGSFKDGNTLINDVVNGEEVIVVGSETKNFMVSFYSKLDNGTTPIFTVVDKNRVILEDNLGNEWDIFGYAVSGPLKGQRLKRTESFIGYWFSWGAFYPNAEIYE